MNKDIDFEKLFGSLEDAADVLDEGGSIEALGFTKDQVRFINVLIESAIKKYHSELFK
ncbi:MAG: hypothetical protein MRZ11_05945 [Allisonella histaminiformans]|uniref:hypothetical protein n=1 Tax=Allisonella histaminiformans TaxID=209880 RepID=UPI0023567729|nr:hypothetical protein [Allisonella histaminiformans]MCI6003822.1 hypothetical protein [Allisonella histaminiformans]